MGEFDEHQVARAIARLPTSATKEVRRLRDLGAERGLDPLVSACDRELARRPFDFSGEEAQAFEVMAEQVADLDLEAAIRHAFARVRPASPAEVRFLRWLADNPGGSYEAAQAAMQNRGLALWIGHLVYDRYGCFRKFMDGADDQSSLLLRKDRSGTSVRYWLKPEAEKVFRELGLI